MPCKKKSPPTEDQIAIKRAKAAARKRMSRANKYPDQTVARRKEIVFQSTDTMPKESKFRRFTSPTYQIARNSSKPSMNTPTGSIKTDLCNISSFVHANRNGNSETIHSANRRSCFQESCIRPFTSPLHAECFGMINWENAANQKEHIFDKRNSVLPQINKEHLKVFNQHLVDVMYRDKQCSNCGSRFKSEDIDKHLDMHFKLNSVRRRVYKPCRLYYGTVKDFLISDAVPVSFTAENKELVSSKCVATKSGLLATSIIDMCHGCHEAISQFFNDDDEEWQLDDAIKIDGNVYHRVCARNFDL